MNRELRQRLYAEATDLASRHPADLEASVGRGQERLRRRVTAMNVLVAVAVLAAAAALVVVRLFAPGGGGSGGSGSASVIGVTVSAPWQQLAPGTAVQAVATAALSDGSSRPLNDGVSWSSADPRVATVDGSGLVHALKEGKVPVTATFGAYSGSLTVLVVPGTPPHPPSGITVRELRVDPQATSVRAGLTSAFSAQLVLSDDSTITPSDLAWTSSDEKVITVDPAGLATAVGAGSAVLKATGKDPLGGSYEGYAFVNVTPPDVVRVQITPATVPILSVGDKPVKLTATVTYTTGVSEVTADASWSSENGEVVRMDDHGNAYPEKAGTSGITAMFRGVTSQPITITVKPIG